MVFIFNSLGNVTAACSAALMTGSTSSKQAVTRSLQGSAAASQEAICLGRSRRRPQKSPETGSFYSGMFELHLP